MTSAPSEASRRAMLRPRVPSPSRAARHPTLSVGYFSHSPINPQCSLWLFSVFSVLNSERRVTENTKIHRELQRNRTFSSSRLFLFPPRASGTQEAAGRVPDLN